VTTGSARALLRRLGQFLEQFSVCFSRQPQRDAATQYIDGLFGDSERKSMQAMHGRLGDARDYQALQHFITHSPWDATRVWAQLRPDFLLMADRRCGPESDLVHRRGALSYQ
jgi:SRSO17 transposase